LTLFGLGRQFTFAARTEFAHDHGSRANTGEGLLKQVRANKYRQPHKSGMNELGKHNREQDHKAGESGNHSF